MRLLHSLKNKIKNLCPVFCCFFVLTAIPLIFTSISKISPLKLDVFLTGFTDPVENTPLTVENLYNGSFQEAAESEWKSTLLPRGVLIKSYNTFNFFLLHECSDSVGSVGNNYSIFQSNYINDYLGTEDYPDYSETENQEKLAEYLSELESINHKLKKIGKTLVFYIAPGKSDYCSEDIPLDYQKNAKDGYVRGIDKINEVISEYDIPYVDCRSVIEEAHLDVPVFYRGGIHMARPAEQICSLAIIDKMSNELGIDFPKFSITGLQSSKKSFWRDSDVLDLCNLWIDLDETYYQYDTEPTVQYNIHNPGILVHGDSYAMGLVNDTMDITPVFYINRNQSYAVGNYGSLCPIAGDFDKIDLQKMLDLSSVVAIEMLACEICDYSYGFVSYLNDYLDSYVPGETLKGISEQEFDKINEDNIWCGLFEDGVYDYENGNAWVGKESSFLLDADAMSETGITIKLRVPYEIKNRSSQGDTADISIDGKVIRQIDLTVMGDMEINIAPEEINTKGKKQISLEINCPYDFVPKDVVRFSNDPRSLSLYMDYIGRRK